MPSEGVEYVWEGGRGTAVGNGVCGFGYVERCAWVGVMCGPGFDWMCWGLRSWVDVGFLVCGHHGFGSLAEPELQYWPLRQYF
jgi:hypothetical protein